MKKALKFLSLGLALVMCMSMAVTPVFAAVPPCRNYEICGNLSVTGEAGLCEECLLVETSQQDVTTDGRYGVDVSIINASTYTVTIPKTLSVTDADTISYEAAISGDIAGTEKLVVAPDANVVLSSDGKANVTATITQNKTEWLHNEFTSEFAVQTIGSIDVSGCSAGEWSGTFNFNISLEDVA